MSDARAQVLGAIRKSLRRDGPSPNQQADIEARLADPPRGPIPARGQLARGARVELFVAMAKEAACTVTHIADRAAVPAAIAEYLARENLPAKLRVAPDAEVADLPWSTRPLLEVTSGRSDGSDEVSLTPALAAIAETGTLMLTSGPERPTTLNFLPETHIVLLTADQVVGGMEEAWAKLRERYGRGVMPRTVNLVTGPSRSADIEQTLQMGAHGPRRLHIILVDGEATAEP
jgi:L-lactate dehydrogenase complex protein LldG